MFRADGISDGAHLCEASVALEPRGCILDGVKGRGAGIDKVDELPRSFGSGGVHHHSQDGWGLNDGESVPAKETVWFTALYTNLVGSGKQVSLAWHSPSTRRHATLWRGHLCNHLHTLPDIYISLIWISPVMGYEVEKELPSLE